MKYETILKCIKSEISKSNIRSGEKLPSIRSICKKFQCSKVTADKVYDLLEKENIVYSIPKSGHYLIDNKLKSNCNCDSKNIDFSTSFPDKKNIPYEEFQHCINEAMNVYKENITLKANTQGLENLIEVTQKQLQNYQVFAHKQCIYITTGSQQAINILTMMEFPNDKENVLIEQPTYYGVIESLKLNKVDITYIKRNKNGIDFAELEKIFKYGNIKFFYTIPRFHNPTGFSYSNEDKKKIINLAEKYDVYIVEDDYLADLEMNKKSDPLYALDFSQRVIYLKSYSKIILPELRISAAVLPKVLIKTFEKYKKWNDLNTSIISQGSLELYIRSGLFDEHMKKLRKVYSKRMGYLNELVKNFENSNIVWHVPDSGFFASFEVSDRVNINDIIKKLKSKNVLIQDPNIFYLDNYLGKKLIRLSVSSVNNIDIKKGICLILEEVNR